MIITPPTPTTGRCGYSREEAIYELDTYSPGSIHISATARLDGVDFTPVYNTLNSGARSFSGANLLNHVRRMDRDPLP